MISDINHTPIAHITTSAVSADPKIITIKPPPSSRMKPTYSLCALFVLMMLCTSIYGLRSRRRMSYPRSAFSKSINQLVDETNVTNATEAAVTSNIVIIVGLEGTGHQLWESIFLTSHRFDSKIHNYYMKQNMPLIKWLQHYRVSLINNATIHIGIPSYPAGPKSDGNFPNLSDWIQQFEKFNEEKVGEILYL